MSAPGSEDPSRGRLLVTGGSGFLGHEVVLVAAAAGWEVVGTFRSHPPADLAGLVRWTALDLRDPGAVDALVAGVDAVVHTAYVERGPDLQAVTVTGSERVARASRQAGARLVHVSTDVVFDGTTARPYVEHDPPRPVHDYGRAKAAAEELVAREHPGAVVVRTSLIYRGPHDPGPLSKHEHDVLAALNGHERRAFFTDEWRNPVQVGDLARALVELASRSEVSGPLHVAGPDLLSRFELASLIAAAHGQDPALVRAGESASIVPPRPRNCPLDTRRAQALLATRLRGAREVLRPRS